MSVGEMTVGLMTVGQKSRHQFICLFGEIKSQIFFKQDDGVKFNFDCRYFPAFTFFFHFNFVLLLCCVAPQTSGQVSVNFPAIHYRLFRLNYCLCLFIFLFSSPSLLYFFATRNTCDSMWSFLYCLLTEKRNSQSSV